MNSLRESNLKIHLASAKWRKDSQKETHWPRSKSLNLAIWINPGNQLLKKQRDQEFPQTWRASPLTQNLPTEPIREAVLRKNLLPSDKNQGCFPKASLVLKSTAVQQGEQWEVPGNILKIERTISYLPEEPGEISTRHLTKSWWIVKAATERAALWDPQKTQSL